MRGRCIKLNRFGFDLEQITTDLAFSVSCLVLTSGVWTNNDAHCRLIVWMWSVSSNLEMFGSGQAAEKQRRVAGARAVSEGRPGAQHGVGFDFELQVVACGKSERTLLGDTHAAMFDDDRFVSIPAGKRTLKVQSVAFRQKARTSSRMHKNVDFLSNYPFKLIRSLSDASLRDVIHVELACVRRADRWSFEVHRLFDVRTMIGQMVIRATCCRGKDQMIGVERDHSLVHTALSELLH